MASCASGRPRPAASSLRSVPDAEVNWLAAEQSNSSLTIGDTVMLKIFRRISPGEHPEAEMSRYLTAAGLYPRAAASWRRGSRCAGRHPAHARGRARIRPQPGRRLVVDARSPDPRARCPCTGRRRREFRSRPVQPTAMRSSPRSAGGSAKCMRYWRARHPMPPSRPRSPTPSDAADWAKKTEERLEKAFGAIAQLQTWEREQDRERAQKLLSQRASIAAAVRNLAKSARER